MKLDQSFAVPAPVDAVWRVLLDVGRVAPCLPGAELTDAEEDGTYRGTFTVKLGPTRAAYRGTLKLESEDEATHTVTMRANGQDRRGHGGAKALIVSRLHEDGEQTRVEVETDFTITGTLARFGRGGMIEDISKRLLRDFAACLGEELARGGGAEPPSPAPGGAGSAPAVGSAPPSRRPDPPSGRPPLDAGALAGDVLRDRLRAGVPVLVAGFLLGYAAGRRGG